MKLNVRRFDRAQRCVQNGCQCISSHGVSPIALDYISTIERRCNNTNTNFSWTRFRSDVYNDNRKLIISVRAWPGPESAPVG
jgi:hypothetical protein